MCNPLACLSSWFDRAIWRPLSNSVIEHWLFGDD